SSPWARAKGALWALGPHVLSLALPVLGPVDRVTAATGLGDTVHLVLGHDGGASSTLTMSQTVPPPAAWIGLAVYGHAGRPATPPVELTPPPNDHAHPPARAHRARRRHQPPLRRPPGPRHRGRPGRRRAVPGRRRGHPRRGRRRLTPRRARQ